MPSHDGYDIVYLFLAGGLGGTVYELFLTLVLCGVLEDRSGSVLTPFNYTYGFGAAAIFLAARRLRNPVSVFAVGCVLGGAVEYGISLVQEYVLGSRSWDYSARPLNINGRTTVPYMLVWGLLCYFAIRFAFPALLRLVHKMPEKVRKKLAAAFLVLMLIDAAVSLLAVVRYSQRAAGVEAGNLLMDLADRIFSDTYMQLHFPNLTLKG